MIFRIVHSYKMAKTKIFRRFPCVWRKQWFCKTRYSSIQHPVQNYIFIFFEIKRENNCYKRPWLSIRTNSWKNQSEKNGTYCKQQHLCLVPPTYATENKINFMDMTALKKSALNLYQRCLTEWICYLWTDLLRSEKTYSKQANI